MTAPLLAQLAELDRIAAARRIGDEETRAFLDDLAELEEAIEDLRREDGESRWEPRARRRSAASDAALAFCAAPADIDVGF